MTARNEGSAVMLVRRHRGRLAAALALAAVVALLCAPAARAQSDIAKTVHNLTP